MERLSKREREKKKKKRGGGGGGERVFKRFKIRSHNIKIYSSCEIEDLVETHLCKLVCDIPIARITHICRVLLYIRVVVGLVGDRAGGGEGGGGGGEGGGVNESYVIGG